MKFALYEFCEDQSSAIGESSWMVDEDDSSFNNVWMTNKEVLVRWPKTSKDYLKWSNKNGKCQLDTEWKMPARYRMENLYRSSFKVPR